jgi:hypothetical protein
VNLGIGVTINCGIDVILVIARGGFRTRLRDERSVLFVLPHSEDNYSTAMVCESDRRLGKRCSTRVLTKVQSILVFGAEGFVRNLKQPK